MLKRGQRCETDYSPSCLLKEALYENKRSAGLFFIRFHVITHQSRIFDLYHDETFNFYYHQYMPQNRKPAS